MNDTNNAMSLEEAPVSVESAVGHLSLISVRMSPRKLAYLDIGLFCSLSKLGTSRERICEVMNLSSEEYDYVCQLG